MIHLISTYRAFIYFAIRYFLKGGILDGYGGWMWNFSALASLGYPLGRCPRPSQARRLRQGLWYRCLVDHEIGKLLKAKQVLGLGAEIKCTDNSS